MAFLEVHYYSAVSSFAGFNALYHDSNACLVTLHVKLFDHHACSTQKDILSKQNNRGQYL